MQNLEQFSGPRSNNDNIPAWMKTKEKYESDAMEKKYGGEEYGTDEENINQKDIERFMKQQRERNRDRSRARFENWIDGKPKQSHPSSKESSPELPQRPLNSNRHGIMSSQRKSHLDATCSRKQVLNCHKDQQEKSSYCTSREAHFHKSSCIRPSFS